MTSLPPPPFPSLPPPPIPSDPPPTRLVVHAEALAWLDTTPPAAGTSVVTSLPDVSEVPDKGFDGWRAWFLATARRIIRWVPDEGVAIFFQSDIRYRGVWVDKGYLVLRAAEEESALLIWHKIVCRKPAGTISHGRSSYSHMVCVSRTLHPPRRPGPDVLSDTGAMTWTKAMGLNACRLACRYLQDDTATRVVVDPFCGHGTILAVANSFGLDAVGVELSAKRCRIARTMGLPPEDS
jgi:hypothetical protein